MNVESFKIIYKDRVLNPIDMNPDFSMNDFENDYTWIQKPKFLDLTFVDEDGEVACIHDETFMFKFVRK